MDDKLLEKVMQEVMKRVGGETPGKAEPAPQRTESRFPPYPKTLFRSPSSSA